MSWTQLLEGVMHGVAVKSGKMPRPTPRAAEEGRGRLGW